MSTYTCAYHGIARNLSSGTLAAAMKANAPLFIDTYTEAGLTLTSDVTSTSGVKATRTITFHDSADPGSMPPGIPMAQWLTNNMTGAIETGVSAPIVADPVVIS